LRVFYFETMTLVDFIDKLSELGPITYDTPFDNKTLVFRIGGKIFLLTNIELWDIKCPKINIKALPENVEKYLCDYDFVEPAYHMNKKHWITVNMSKFNQSKLFFNWIQDSYELVYESLTKKIKNELNENK